MPGEEVLRFAGFRDAEIAKFASTKCLRLTEQGLERLMDRPQLNYPDWPALMRPDTLRAYLDCRSGSDFARKLKALSEKGYPGMDPILKRHVKAFVDRALNSEGTAANSNDEAASQRTAMLRAARGETR